MKTIGKKMLAAVMAGSMVLAAGCGNGGSNGGSAKGAHEISYWIPMGENVEYYESYNDNPIVKYIEANYTFNGKPIDFDFYVAPAGSQSDNFTTLLSTGEYCDIMDLSMSPSSPVQLYEDGILQDLTQLVPEHMPNYMAFLEANPDIAPEIYSIVDGEKKILFLTGFYEKIDDNYEGFCYRRDWIAKYGKHPETGEAFTYGFADEADPLSWEDNVVFPSGGSDPVYISDWEWMFEIFDVAMADLGIMDGYGYAPYYLGYMSTGDLACAFGGGGNTSWYRNQDNQAVFGPTTDNFRTYLQCMNTWYKNGWIDPAFAEHNGDMFFSVDPAKVFSGKVGLWQGLMSTLGTQIDADDAYTDGAVVYGCRQPINDVYGGPEAQNIEPYTFMQYSKAMGSIGLTDHMSEEETIAVLEFVDFLFTEEGSALSAGLSKAQYEACQDEFYTAQGLTEGAYTKEGDTYVSNVSGSDPRSTAIALTRVIAKRALPIKKPYDRYVEHAVSQWDYYTALPSIFSASITNAMSADESSEVSTIRTNVDQFMIRSISPMIMGTGYDVWDDVSWEQFCTDINKFQPDRVTEIYNEKIKLLAE